MLDKDRHRRVRMTTSALTRFYGTEAKMKGKRVRDARGALTAIRQSAIADITIGIMVWVGLAFLVGVVRGAEAAIGIIEEFRPPWGHILFFSIGGIGLAQVGGGIYTLHCHNKISEVFKEAFPDEDDD